MARMSARKSTAGPGPPVGRWRLKLFIAGYTGKSVIAIANLKRICAEQLPGGCDVEVIDLLADPAQAKAHEIVALPTLVRVGPGPARHRVLGDLSNTQRVLSGLALPVH
jgi:circadian clock protein KaiB